MRPATAIADQSSSSDDQYIPDPEVQRRYNITAMTLWRWDHDQTLGFPPPIRIRHRKYRSAKALAEFERRRAAAVEKG